MSLRAQAEADLTAFLNDDAEFGFAITVTDPTETVAGFSGFSSDVALTIDPDTGEAVSGRRASVTLSLSDIAASALTGIPEGISDEQSKPWLVQFEDINGNPFTFKVFESNPDRAIGAVVCLLEVYKT